MKKSLKTKLRIRVVALTLLSLVLIQSGIVAVSILQNRRDLESKSDMLIAQIHHNPSTANRYFSVKLPAGKDTVYPDAVQHVSVTAEESADFARRALAQKRERGFLDVYRYRVYRNENGTKIYFLHRASAIETCRSAAWNMIGVSLAGLLAIGLILIPLSAWIVKPIVDNHNKQKQFITSASHQLKTPLTVISTDAQMLQEEIGQSPWLDGILKQTEHLTKMTGELVLLSKAEEFDSPLHRARFSFSDVLRDEAEGYAAAAKQKNVQMELHVEETEYCGSPDELRQLFRVLLDNACKYCPEKGTIRIEAKETFRGVRLQIANTAEAALADSRLLTERFQRGRNAAGTGGFGLGLSIAKAIAERHDGRLRIAADGKGEFRVEVILR